MDVKIALLLVLTLCLVAEIAGKSWKHEEKRKNTKPKKPKHNAGWNNGKGWKLGHWKKLFRRLGFVKKGESVSAKTLKKFIVFYKIQQNATIASIEAKFLDKGRCGDPDLMANTDFIGTDKRRKRSDIYAPWPKTDITYAFESFSSSSALTAQQQHDIFIRAFNIWRAAVPVLTFTEVSPSANPDLKLSFVTGAHGCNYPFDTSNSEIAHAFYPTNGQIHFNDYQQFTASTTSGVYLLFGAIHEIGHALGMDHATRTTSVMYPYFNGITTLDSLDVDNIRNLYVQVPGNRYCPDQDSYCPTYKYHGYCIDPDLEDVMKQMCPASCGYC